MKLKLSLLAVATMLATSPAFAVDYSLQSECSRLGQRYMADQQIETVSAVYAGRQGGDTFYMKLAGSSDYVSVSNVLNPRVPELATDAAATRRRVNLCIRPGDNYLFGIETRN